MVFRIEVPVPIANHQIDDVARLLAALGEGSRLRIVRALWDGPRTVGEIADDAGLKQANASKQLALLVETGILTRRRDGIMVRYEIALPLVRELCAIVCDCARDAAERRFAPYASTAA